MRIKIIKQLIEDKTGQELPGWAYIVGLILALFAIVFVLWLSFKSGKVGVEQIVGIE